MAPHRHRIDPLATLRRHSCHLQRLTTNGGLDMNRIDPARGRHRQCRRAQPRATLLSGLLLAGLVLGSAMASAQDTTADDATAQDATAQDTRESENAEGVVVEPPPITAAAPGSPAGLPQARSAADGLYVEFGRGVRMTSDDELFSLMLRGRVQTRATWRDGDGTDPDILFQIRRARLVLLGDLRDHDISLYVQLGLGASDIERDLPVPLRDAVVTWSGARDASVRAGQMKVPFSRERIISSSALQLADRSAVNAELNLDRDVGIQLYSSDLLGLGSRVAYQAGVYGGEGRNRAAPGTGMLYAGRIQVQPLGAFPDSMLEADLSRSSTPRLSLGVAGAINRDTRRVRSTHGAFLPEGWSFDTHHAAGDLLFKVSGFSLQAEAIWRGARLAQEPSTETGEELEAPLPRTGLGWFVQSGYVLENGLEFAGRVSMLVPSDEDESAMVSRRDVSLALGRYMRQHDLKLQADYTMAWTGPNDTLGHEARLQMQVFF